MRFTKMHGAGNDYVYVNCFREPLPDDPAELARQVSDRHFGIGGDGLILICPTDAADARMRMFNADGSESEMCGNGIRCVAKYVYDHGIARKDTLQIETGRGVLSLDVQTEGGRVDRVRVDMGEPILAPADVPTDVAGQCGGAGRARCRGRTESGRPGAPGHLRLDGQPALRHLCRPAQRSLGPPDRAPGGNRPPFPQPHQCRVHRGDGAGRGPHAGMGARFRRDTRLRYRRQRRLRGRSARRADEPKDRRPPARGRPRTPMGRRQPRLHDGTGR